MQVCTGRSVIVQVVSAGIKLIPLFVVTILLCSQSTFAKSTRHGYHRQYKYAKEDFKPKPQFWGGLEYMSMWEQDGPINVPLVTQNNNPASIGYIGEPGTEIIYGSGSGQDLDYDNINGGRVTLGGWIDYYHLYGVEFSGFLLEKVYTNFNASEPGGTFPIIAVPYYATQPTPIESAVSASNNPNAISVNTSSQLWGAELDFVYNASNMINYPLEALIGFRYMSLNETLSLNDTIYDTTGRLATDGVVFYSDDFQTQNNFYGLELGLRSKLAAQNRFTLDFIVKVALGENAEKIDVNGNTLITKNAFGNGTGNINAGIFAQPSNIGNYSHNTFAVLPEAQIKLGYMIAPNVHPYISYDVMYLNNVVRPGEQINRNINPTENPTLTGATTVSGGLSPGKPSFNNTSFWIQGVTVGLEVSL